MSKPRTQLKRSSWRDVDDRDRLARGGDPAGDAHPPAEADLADLGPVEAVRRGQRQARLLVVGQVERADLDAHRHGRAVDDRAHQLVPVARQRRQLGDLVQERELVEPAVGRRRSIGGSIGHHRPIIAHRTRGSDVASPRSAAREHRDLVMEGDEIRVLRPRNRAGPARPATRHGGAQRASSRRPASAWKQARLYRANAADRGGQPPRSTIVWICHDRSATADPSPTRSATEPAWMIVCSAPLPMIEPTVRSTARVASSAASTSAIRSVALASASCCHAVPRPVGTLGVDDRVGRVGLAAALGLRPAFADRGEPFGHVAAPRPEMGLDVLGRPLAIGRWRVPVRGVEGLEHGPFGRPRRAEGLDEGSVGCR